MTNRPARSAAWASGSLPAWMLALIACIAYANAWPDALALDDASFAVGDRFSHLAAADYLRFFNEDLWAASGVESGLYRPLLLVSFAVDAALFGDWAAGYHLVNILLHAMATLLVFGFCRRVVTMTEMRSQSVVPAAFCAALIFAVHPVHAEAVNSVFNRSDILVSIGIAGGLGWFLRVRSSNPVSAWIVLALVYFLVLLCKESGVVLPALAILAVVLTRSDGVRDTLRQCLPVFVLLVPLALYLLLRVHALGSAASSLATATDGGGISAAGAFPLDFSRFPRVIIMWFESLRLLLWPHPLTTFHKLPQAGFWPAMSVQLVLAVTALIAWLRGRQGLLAGLGFFYLALLPASRIIGEPGMVPHVAERYLYLPSVGLSLMLAIEYEWLTKRVGRRWVHGALLGVAVVFLSLTWARNQDWSSAVVLAETDYARDPDSGRVTETLLEALLAEGAYDRAAELCHDRSADLKDNWFLSNSCGIAWFRTGQLDAAEQAFLRATAGDNAPSAHFNLAGMYLKAGRRSAAREQFEAGIEAERVDFVREYRIADMQIQMFPGNRAELLDARSHLETALELQPQFFQARRKLEELDRLLGVD